MMNFLILPSLADPKMFRCALLPSLRMTTRMTRVATTIDTSSNIVQRMVSTATRLDPSALTDCGDYCCWIVCCYCSC